MSLFTGAGGTRRARRLAGALSGRAVVRGRLPEPDARSQERGASLHVIGLELERGLELRDRVLEEPHLGVGDAEVEVSGGVRASGAALEQGERPFSCCLLVAFHGAPRIAREAAPTPQKNVAREGARFEGPRFTQSARRRHRQSPPENVGKLLWSNEKSRADDPPCQGVSGRRCSLRKRVVGWCRPRSSKSERGSSAVLGRFDSCALPPEMLPVAHSGAASGARSARNAGAAAATARATTMHAMPPLATLKRAPASSATAPASTSPSCGPLTKKIMLMAPMRPRSASGVIVWRTTCRTTVLTVSAAPEPARSASASGNDRATPKPVTHAVRHHGAITASPMRDGRPPREVRRHHQGPHGRRRGEHPEPARADGEDLVGEDGQEQERAGEEVRSRRLNGA